MAHRRNWRSALEGILGSRQQLRVEPTTTAQKAAAPGEAAYACPSVGCDNHDLLLMRIDALRLDPTRLKAAMPTEFRALARVCSYCQDTARCERDLVYEAAGRTVDWEQYCPNAFRLRAMGLLEVSGQSADPDR